MKTKAKEALDFIYESFNSKIEHGDNTFYTGLVKFSSRVQKMNTLSQSLHNFGLNSFRSKKITSRGLL